MSIFKRVSVREFTEEAVADSDIEMILRAGMQAPSAVNQQPWEFLVCKDLAVIRSLAETGGYARSLKTAQALLVLYYRETVSHPMFTMQDMGACAENCLLEATALNLGAVWMGIAPKEDRMSLIEDIFGKIPNAKPFCLIALGHPKTDIKQTSRYDQARIHYYKK